MSYARKVVTTVGDGGVIHVTAPDLPAGETVEVTIATMSRPRPRGSAMAILARAPGGRIFKTAEEVDAYIREERGSWER